MNLTSTQLLALRVLGLYAVLLGLGLILTGALSSMS